jgi:hypothetical protein
MMRRRLECDGWSLREIHLTDHFTDPELRESALHGCRIGFRPNAHTLRLVRDRDWYEFSTEKNFSILYAVALYILVHRRGLY